jgi:cytochrome oxidase assembly protein ShyY1
LSTFWGVARRPRWIAAFFLALAIAAAFAALGQWQLERSFEASAPLPQQTEVRVPLDTIAEPQQPMPAATIGQLVSLTAEFVPSDYLVLSDRITESRPGYWVVGHGVVESGASVAVALGWCETADAAASAIRTLRDAPPAPTIEGRYLPSESPQESDFEAGQLSALAVAELVNLWGVAPDGVYSGYVIVSDPPAGLEVIDAPPPSTEVSLNLLNVFYAVEWVIFAGFAIFLWYRLVRDAVEEENAAAETGETPPVE